MEWVSEKTKLSRSGRFLLGNRLVSRTWGNLSILLEDGTFIISPSGKSYLETDLSDIARVSMKTLKCQGDCKPSSEMMAHVEIYNGGFEAMACVHTHQIFATAISTLANCYLDSEAGEKYGAITDKLLKCIPQDIGESFVSYAMAGSEKLVENIRKTIPKVKKNKNSFIILANHGVIGWGKSMEEAIKVAMDLEIRCEEICRGLHCIFEPLKLAEMTVDEIGEKLKEDDFIFSPKNCIYKIEGNKYICHANQREVKAVKDKCLKGYIDDFGQIVGAGVNIEDDGSIKLEADNLEDLYAMYEITRKNALAWQVAQKFGAEHIEEKYLEEMREKYVNYYSKLK